MDLGAFRLDERIGRGAMGDVWRARHRSHDTPVAIKAITTSRASREDYREHFRNEIRAAAALNHPGIVDVYDYGHVDHETAADAGLAVRPGSPFFAMELADAGSLDQFESEMTWSALRELLVGLLEALSHAHARGVFHRDLKPSNVLLVDGSAGRQFKISDFGLAFDRRRAIERDPSEEGAVGTPHYMAPEQLRSRWRDIGPWTDLYGLGCMTWKLVTGEPAFQGEGLLAVAREHLTEPLPEFEPLLEVPESFEGWLARLLEKHPHDRFRRAADALWALLEMPESLAGDSTPVDVDRRPTVERTGVTEPLESLADDTRLEPSLEMEPPAAGTDLAPEGAETPDLGIEPLDRELPPVPGTWTQQRPPSATGSRLTVGRELFGFKEFPTVGRRETRDRLWRALREVADRGSARAVLLRGDSGVGKTRLARWLAERAEEVGAATVVRASHDPQAPAGGGLAEALAERTSVRELDRDEVADRLETWYRARGVDRPYEWRAMTEFLSDENAPIPEEATATLQQWDDERTSDPVDRPEAPIELDDEVGAGPVQFSSAQEIRALVRRFLEAAARERPVVVHLDDLQWAPEALELVRYVLESVHAEDLPVLFVGTLRDDALAERPLAEERVGAVADLEAADVIELEPMAEEDQLFLVEELLHLEAKTARRVVDRSAGNPLFAVELVRDWIERDLLEPTDRGFRLAEGADRRVPDDLYEVWGSRLDEVTGEAPEEARLALQLGATLGEEIDEGEWRAACREIGAEFPGRLVERMLRRRLLRETDGGWRLAHSALRETLLRRARESGRWERLNRACAAVVDPDDDPERAERYARFLIAAGDREAALEPLLTAIEELGRRTRYQRADALLELAAACADEVDLADRPDLACRLHHARGRLALVVDADPDRAEEALDRAAEEASRADDWQLRARTLVARAAVAGRYDAPERALELARRAAEGCERCDCREYFEARHRAATSRQKIGELEAALKTYRDLWSRRSTIARREDRLELIRQWARCLLHAGKTELSRRRSRRGLGEARLLSSPERAGIFCNLLGEAALVAGDLDSAERWYLRAERYAKVVDLPNNFYKFLGRVQVALKRGEHEWAIDRISSLRDRFRRRAPPQVLVAADVLATEALAHIGNWSALDTVLRRLADRNFPGPIPDVVPHLRAAAERAAEAGRSEAPDELERLAAELAPGDADGADAEAAE